VDKRRAELEIRAVQMSHRSAVRFPRADPNTIRMRSLELLDRIEASLGLDAGDDLRRQLADARREIAGPLD
jgi:hypothetical protein